MDFPVHNEPQESQDHDFSPRLRRNGAAALASAMKVWSRSEGERYGML